MKLTKAVILSNGAAGEENQSIGLLQALQLKVPVELQRIENSTFSLGWLARPLPTRIHDFFSQWAGGPSKEHEVLAGVPSSAEQLMLVIACGNETAPLALQMKRKNPRSVFVVMIQLPDRDCSSLDVVVCPAHEWLHCSPPKNVFLTQGVLTQVSGDTLAAARHEGRNELSNVLRPLLVVSLGGPNDRARYNATMEAEGMASLVKAAMERSHIATCIVAFSHRTPREVKDLLSVKPWIQVWEGSLMALIAWADAIAVTADSITTVCESGSTGKPVFTIAEAGVCSKLVPFYRYLQARGVTQPLDLNGLATFRDRMYAPLDDAQRAAQRVAHDFKDFLQNRYLMYETNSL